jgi:3'(2'), 5'-bisphosphate nucleotidase
MKQQSEPAGEILTELCRLAEQAGAKAMRFYDGSAAVTLKKDSSPLTDADRASHEFLVNSLPGLLAGVPVVSEESQDPTAGAVDAERFWLVDPLDGTKEFLKGTGEFTVNIALVEKGQPVAGVVYAPALDLIYFADIHKGGYRRKRNEVPTAIHVQRANRDAFRVVASKDHAGPLVQSMLARMPGAELKSMGSSLKFCLVAEGSADIYLRDVPTMEWDTAAAQCVVEAAGGHIFTLDGKPLRYGKAGLKNPSIVTVGDATLDWPALVRNS